PGPRRPPLEQAQQRGGIRRPAQPLLRARERPLEALLVERLEQVVDGGQVERADGVLVVRGHEDDGGRVLRADRLDDLDPAQLGHRDVEEDEVRTLAPDELDGGPAIAALADERQAVRALDQRAQPAARGRLVLRQEGTDGRRHAGSLPIVRQGMRSRTRVPPPGAGPTSSDAPGPSPARGAPQSRASRSRVLCRPTPPARATVESAGSPTASSGP